jgi:hypothetical protein
LASFCNSFFVPTAHRHQYCNMSMQQQQERVRPHAQESGWKAPPLAGAALGQSLQCRRIRLCSQMELASRIGSRGGSISPPTACPNNVCAKKITGVVQSEQTFQANDGRYYSGRHSIEREFLAFLALWQSQAATTAQQHNTECSEARGRYCARLAPAAPPALPSLPPPILSKKLACDDLVSAGSIKGR